MITQRQRAVHLAFLAVLAVVIGLLSSRSGPSAQTPPAPGPRPNVLVIVTDDQRSDTLEVMPKTRGWFEQGGTIFSDNYVTIPLCCPSRSSIFTGRYSHNHGVRTNRDAPGLDQRTTMQAYLHDAGYQTAISGKFLLYWDLSKPPPNFDHWAIVNETDYYGDTYSVDGKRQRVDQYSTDFIAERALEFLDRFEADDARPWFLYVATQAPHDPFIAEPDYENAPVPEWQPSPGVSEKDRSDKPPWVSVHGVSQQEAAQERQAQLRTLMSVDDLVDALFRRMETLGENDTLAVYTADNGYFWGEHRQKSKGLPYTESIRVPLLLRWPGRVPPGVVDPRLAATIDVAPTVLQATGVTAGSGPPMDGRSLLTGEARAELLVEYAKDPGFRYPDWASLRDPTAQYIEWYEPDGAASFREYYDLVADPYQLENLLGDADPANDPDVTARASRLAQLRTCSGRAGPSACP